MRERSKAQQQSSSSSSVSETSQSVIQLEQQQSLINAVFDQSPASQAQAEQLLASLGLRFVDLELPLSRWVSDREASIKAGQSKAHIKYVQRDFCCSLCFVKIISPTWVSDVVAALLIARAE